MTKVHHSTGIRGARGQWKIVDLIPAETAARLSKFRDRLATVAVRRQVAQLEAERESRKVA